MRRLLGSMVVTLVVFLGAASAAHANNGNGNANGNRKGNGADNGNSAAHATVSDDQGKPCDGCVGNADGKQPPGQTAGDKNAGYECDRNNGIGQGNPAHSACPTTTTSTTLKAAVAATTTTSTTVATAVLGEHFNATTTTVPTQVLGEHFARGDLANTGGPAWLTGVGLPLVLIGFGLVTLQRRMEQRAAQV